MIVKVMADSSACEEGTEIQMSADGEGYVSLKVGEHTYDVLAEDLYRATELLMGVRAQCSA
jgi:hypothetical protein